MKETYQKQNCARLDKCFHGRIEPLDRESWPVRGGACPIQDNYNYCFIHTGACPVHCCCEERLVKVIDWRAWMTQKFVAATCRSRLMPRQFAALSQAQWYWLELFDTRLVQQWVCMEPKRWPNDNRTSQSQAPYQTKIRVPVETSDPLINHMLLRILRFISITDRSSGWSNFLCKAKCPGGLSGLVQMTQYFDVVNSVNLMPQGHRSHHRVMIAGPAASWAAMLVIILN